MIAPFSVEQVDRHIECLKASGVSDVKRTRWQQRLASSDSGVWNAAGAELIVREVLEKQGLCVRAHELTQSDGGPDFRCQTADGAAFLVEVTTVSVEKTTKETGLSDDDPPKTWFRRWAGTQGVYDAVNAKHAQCSDSDVPVALVVATWHSAASLCVGQADVAPLLLGPESIHQKLSLAGDAVGAAWPEPNPDCSVFYRRPTPDDYEWKPGLPDVSLVALCALSSAPPAIRGVMNPGARRPFRPSWTPGIPIGQLISAQPHGTRIAWHNEAEIGDEGQDSLS